ncbi:TPA: deoxycytidylate deaminase, partial [Escherichia coli]
CLEISDIYVENPEEENVVCRYSGLANQLIKFTSLMKRPGIITPSNVERCMQIAYTAKLNSGCISRQVGAAVSDSSFSIKSIGWNDVPSGQVPCSLRDRFDLSEGIDDIAYSEFEKNENSFI